MMKIKNSAILILILTMSAILFAQEDVTSNMEHSFEAAANSIMQQLKDSTAELERLREQSANEKVPLHKKLRDLESELIEVRLEYQQASRLLDSRTLDLSNLRNEIKQYRDEASYIANNLLSDYARNFESRLHIAELQRYEAQLEEVKLAMENSSLSEQEICQKQIPLLSLSLERLNDGLGGTSFTGKAVDSTGLVKNGTFIMMGPAALFLSEDGQTIGTVEQRLGSLEPTVIKFGLPEDSTAAVSVVSNGVGMFPLDPTLGNAHKIEETKETFMDEFNKGGEVMYAIFGLAAAALLVACFKWLSMSFVQTPSTKQINALLKAITQNDEDAVVKETESITKMKPTIVKSLASGGLFGALLGVLTAFLLKQFSQNLPSGPSSILQHKYYLLIFAGAGAVLLGVIKFVLDLIFGHSPSGLMLRAGVDHIREPRELIEEVMYEKILAIRLKLERMLPFIAISASAAPLLGLLGTVTGIISTFKLLTVFGSGDVKSLSGGISEALITTKYGLIVAIPSLLMHAFLSRRARGAINSMEKAAVALVNQVSKSDFNNESSLTSQQPSTETEVDQLLESPAEQATQEPEPIAYSNDSAGGIMNTQVFSVDKTATVADVINKMRTAQISEDVDAVYIVDEDGKYWGHVLIHHLLTRPEHAPVESLADKTPLYARVDTHKNDVQTLFNRHELINLPVVDHDGQLVGRVTRNGNG